MEGSENQGIFLQTTYALEIARLQQITTISPELRQLVIRLYQDLNKITLALNRKTSGVYDIAQEFVTGNTFFPNPALSSTSTPQTPVIRQEYRTTIDFGALPNAATKSVPHMLTLNNSWRFTAIYATATDTTNLVAIPIPYVSNGGLVGAGPVEIWVDAVNVNINTTVNMTNFDQCIVVLEYLKY